MEVEKKKVILITGASSGIGLASAERLAADGYIVYGTMRTQDKAEPLRAIGVRPLIAEMTDFATLERAVEAVIAEEGRIDVLCNNAGFAQYGAMENVPIDDVRYQFEVNVYGMGYMTQLVLPYMRNAGGGRIINTSSMGGHIYMPLASWYHATKHAVEGWSDCLRLELKPFGIDVVILEPGAIRTNFYKALDTLTDKSKGTAYEEVTRRFVKTLAPETYSDPAVIADLMRTAVSARRPKTRYRGGKYAKLLIFIRRTFGDRVFDWVIMGMLK